MAATGIAGTERIAEPPLALRPARLSSRVVAAAGRYVLVWMSLAMMAAADHPLDTAGAAGVSLAAAAWLGALRVSAAGTPYAFGPWGQALIGTSTGLVCVAALNPYLPGLGLSLLGMAGAGLGVLVSIGVWESVIERTLGRLRVLVVGGGAIPELAAAAQRGRGMTLAFLDGDAAPTSGSVLDALDEIVAVRRPDLIVLTDEQTCDDALARLLDIADGRFRVASLTSFYEYALGCVPVRLVTPMWFMSLLHVRRRPYSRWATRTFDLVVAALALAIAVPLLPLIALAVRRTPGPVIYRQTRVGEGGRRFTIYKIRTMVDRAERPGEPVWARDADPRTTSVGAFLRRTHLDELPQLFNVLRGDMSIVGPRPERPELIAMLERNIPFWSRRLLIKPGITGWAQVHCGYASGDAGANEKLAYDFWYLRHRTLAVDIAVCLRTLWIVLDVLDPDRMALRRWRAARQPVAP
jgi:exopolysaccharide biosynthesis polyprenyl glycosylphosphotransferase